MSRYTVKVGKEFEIKAAQIEEHRTDSNHPKIIVAEHRITISMIVFGSAAFFMSVAGFLGFGEGNFDKLQNVYNVAVIPVSAILGFYFNKDQAA